MSRKWTTEEVEEFIEGQGGLVGTKAAAIVARMLNWNMRPHLELKTAEDDCVVHWKPGWPR